MRLFLLVAVVGCATGDALQTAPNEFTPPVDTGNTGLGEAGWPQDWTDDEREVFRQSNVMRAVLQVCGGVRTAAVRPLVWNDQLRDAARAHSEDMAKRNFFAHTAPDGSTPSDRAFAAGYTSGGVGENIAAGQSTPTAVVEAWMDSPGHCRNIMDGSYVTLGVGLYVHDGVPFWTQVFGTSL